MKIKMDSSFKLGKIQENIGVINFFENSNIHLQGYKKSSINKLAPMSNT